MNNLTTTLAAQMQNAPGHPLCRKRHSPCTPGQSLYRTGIHLQKKELDEQIKTQLAKIGFEL